MRKKHIGSLSLPSLEEWTILWVNAWRSYLPTTFHFVERVCIILFLHCLCSNGLYMPHGRNEAGFKTRQLSQHSVIAASWECLLLKCCISTYFVISMISKGDLLLHVATSHCQLFDGIWAPGRVLGSLTALLLGKCPIGYMKSSHQWCQYSCFSGKCPGHHFLLNHALFLLFLLFEKK